MPLVWPGQLWVQRRHASAFVVAIVARVTKTHTVSIGFRQDDPEELRSALEALQIIPQC